MAVYERVSGRFLAPDGSPLSGSVVFAPAFLFARDSQAVTLPAPVVGVLDDDGRVEVSLLVPGEGVEPDSWGWRACPQLRHAGQAVSWESFAFELTAGSPVNLAQVAPVPDPVTGEFMTRGPAGAPGEKGEKGEKGDTPSGEEIRPVVEAALPPVVEEAVGQAVAPLAPSVADAYPPHGPILLEEGKTLHILSLDGEATISFPASGTPGQSFILAIIRGAQYARIPGLEPLADTGSSRTLWASVVHGRDSWEVAPQATGGSGTANFTAELEAWKRNAGAQNMSAEELPQAMVNASGWVKNFTEYMNERAEDMDLGQIDSDREGSKPQQVENARYWVDYLVDQHSVIAKILSNRKVANQFFAWMGQNLMFGSAPSPEDAPFFFPPNGHTAILQGDDSGATLMLGEAYEVVGLDEGAPRLRVRIRPYADGSYRAFQDEGMPIAHPHAGEIYEVPLTRVEEP
ncbi:hypothetical protein ACN082_09725 [Rothia sp. CCM 9417]|uniref:hypothetical protein n=1 Tax=Rothia sp. CCM 9417 TaxID=3402657 RepID=UPI003AE7EDE1